MSHTMKCGIDFGTSNTTMAVISDDQSRLVPLEGHHLTIPTAIFYTAGNKDILFGRAAVAAYLDGREGRFMRSLKRVLGTSLMDSTVLINGTRTNFDVIIGRFLSHIKDTAEQHLGHALSNVTMGRPVHFQDSDPSADARAEEQLRRIAESVGFTDVSFQYEPIAGALAHEKNVVGEQLALVIDIGGGTSDFSVIRLSRDFERGRNRAQDILVNTGVRIGGNDCDKAINLDAAMPLLGMGSTFGDKNLAMPLLMYHELSEWSKINWCYTPQNINSIRHMIRDAHEPEKIMRLEAVLEEQLGHKILNVSEELKIALTEVDESTGNYGFIDRDCQVPMTQQQMNALMQKTLGPVEQKMLETLDQVQLTRDDIALVVLTGGSTGLPVFQDWLARYFPHAEILQDNKLGSVGLGLVL